MYLLTDAGNRKKPGRIFAYVMDAAGCPVRTEPSDKSTCLSEPCRREILLPLARKYRLLVRISAFISIITSLTAFTRLHNIRLPGRKFIDRHPLLLSERGVDDREPIVRLDIVDLSQSDRLFQAIGGQVFQWSRSRSSTRRGLRVRC